MNGAFCKLRDANLNIQSAEHVLANGYKMTNNHRLLLSITLKVYESLLFLSDYLFISNGEVDNRRTETKRLDYLRNSDFSSEAEMKNFISNIGDIVKFHKGSSVEFSRDGCFVICQDDYRYRKISKSDVERFISYANLLKDRVAASAVLENG